MCANQATRVKLTRATPFFAVSNMDRSLRFYTDGLGFEIDNKWVDEGKLRWCWLQRDDVSIMLQEFRTEGPNAGSTVWEHAGEGISISISCDDAVAIYKEITDRGVEAEKPFVGNMLHNVGVTDPDGYKLTFQSPS